jgi:hypothetical protein
MNCKHVKLTLLSGPIHPVGRDYYCEVCGEQFVVKPFTIGIAFGTEGVQSDSEVKHEST